MGKETRYLDASTTVCQEPRWHPRGLLAEKKGIQLMCLQNYASPSASGVYFQIREWTVSSSGNSLLSLDS